jgi:ATP-dependent Zn protease
MHLPTCEGASCLCRAITIHEAGHAVMALVLGCKVEAVTVVPTDDAAGGVRYRAPTDTIDALVILAGPAAEVLALGELDGAEVEDFDEAAKIIAAERVPAMLDTAVALLGAHWTTVERLAQVLCERPTLSGHDMQRALRGLLRPLGPWRVP